jgi:hypothetical protein
VRLRQHYERGMYCQQITAAGNIINLARLSISILIIHGSNIVDAN